MLPAPAPPSSSNSIAYSRARDASLCDLLSDHPVTVAMLVALGWFPGKDTALRRLRRLESRRKIRLIGTVRRGAGRPEHVYARHRHKGNQLLHELAITEVCLRLDAGAIQRGPALAADPLRPDAKLLMNGELFYLEVDRGTMGYAQIQRRYQQYAGCPQIVLWVSATETRLEGLRSRAADVRFTPLFATLAEATTTPHAAVWRDVTGDRVALPRDLSK